MSRKNNKARTKATVSTKVNQPARVRGSKVVVYFRGVQTVGTVIRRRADRGGIYYVDINTDAGIERAAYKANQVVFLTA